MKSHFNQILIGFLSIGLLSACSKSDTVTADNSNPTITIDSTITSTGTAEGNTDSAYDADDLVENTTFTSTVKIQLGTTPTIDNPLENIGVSISHNDGDIVITSTVEGVAYELSGTATDGSVKIYSDHKFKLTLDGVNITNNDGPAINIQSGKRAFIVLADNTTNTLTDGSSYVTNTDEDMKGTLFSEGQMIFSGDGSLEVQGNYKHAIVSDDYIRIRSGNITVTGSVKDGFHTNDAIIVDGGTIDITSGSDAMECEEGYIVINDGDFTINAGDDGITASYTDDQSIDPYVTINGGSFNIQTSGDGEGIESKSTLTINDGEFYIIAEDDGLNAGTALYINGGQLYVYSTSNDGIDSNGSLTVTGGLVISCGTQAPEEGFDCDNNTFKITGGTLLGIGGSTSEPTASVSTQPSVILGGGSKAQIIHIESTEGDEVLTFVAPREYSTLLYSSPKLELNTDYLVYTDGSVNSGTNFNGLYLSGTYTKGTQSSTTFTTSEMVTMVGGSIGPGGGPGGGGPGGMPGEN